MSFTVAIVGRPNVGKSTLFNRLTGKRSALVDDMPGVTRDRRQGKANLGGLEFTLVDTAGLENADTGTLQARMTAQTELAIAQADVALMIVDGRVGITPVDEYFAKLIRRTQKNVRLIVNKAEGGKASATLAEGFRLGLGEPVGISAEHGEGLTELYEALLPFAAKQGEGAEETDPAKAVMQVAIVGRPNVGKSTLMNQILGEERVLTGPEAGITRDAIAIEHKVDGRLLKLVDTAGMRKKSNVTGKVEKLAVADSLEAIQFAHVVVLVIDANEPLEKQENNIASLVEQEGRAMVVALNKWDTVDDKPAYLKAAQKRLETVLPQVKGITMVPISGKTGDGVKALFKACFKTYDLWNSHIGTGELNRWLEEALSQHAPPLVNSRRVKIRYITQKSARPPSFLLFANTSDIPEHYLRYLVNNLRQSFNLPGIPIRLKIRKNKNPYAGKERSDD